MAQRKGGLFGVDPTRQGEDAAEGEGIGTLLRHRRESLGQDIPAVSRQLRIRAVYITAIEEGRLFDLPGTAYAVGFVRAYADYLGLDGNAIVGDYREELARRSRQNDLVWPAEEAVPKFPGGTILVVLALIALAGYAGYYYTTQPGGTGIQLIDAVPEYIKKATGVGEAAPEAPAPETPAPAANPAPAPADAGQTQGQAAPALPAEELPSATAIAPETAPLSPPVDGTGDVLPSPDGAEPAPGEAEAPADATAPAETPTPPPAPDQSPSDASAAPLPAARVVVRADRDSWVEIRDSQDAVVIQRVLRQGETFNVPDEPGLVMNTGNAGGVVIEVDGRPLHSLGSLGVVKRGIKLDPAKLIDGSAFQSE
jgi:cytoskeleton protein RodZ